jgi:hypothetical protein
MLNVSSDYITGKIDEYMPRYKDCECYFWKYAESIGCEIPDDSKNKFIAAVTEYMIFKYQHIKRGVKQ